MTEKILTATGTTAAHPRDFHRQQKLCQAQAHPQHSAHHTLNTQQLDTRASLAVTLPGALKRASLSNPDLKPTQCTTLTPSRSIKHQKPAEHTSICCWETARWAACIPSHQYSPGKNSTGNGGPRNGIFKLVRCRARNPESLVTKKEALATYYQRHWLPVASNAWAKYTH